MSQRTAVQAVVLMQIFCGVAWALINPRFTPIHLMQEVDVVFAGSLEATADPMQWKLTATTTIKGKPAASVIVGLVDCEKDYLEQIQETFKDNKEPVILFYDSKAPEKQGRLHVMGQWMSVKAGAKVYWQIVGPAPDMNGTFTGGTNMLIRMAQYIARDSDPEVPITVSVKWTAHARVAKLAGDVAGMAAVELGKPAKTRLFLGSSEGDKLFRAKGEEVLEDVTAAAGLDSKSWRFAWLDNDGDGLADLVTWDGETLSVRLADKDGALKAAKNSSLPLPACLGLAACSTDGRPGVLVSTAEAPLLLVAGAKGWKKSELPGGQEEVGQPSSCVVADLDNDGFSDVLQPGQRGSILWKGKAGGFEKPVRVDIATGGRTAQAAVGDFDQNGFLDIFLAGQERNTLWENDGKGGFREVFRYGGSISYKCPAVASSVQVMDLNHDGRQDLCLGYEQNDLLYHFNRGFRSFGEEGELRLPGTQSDPGEPRLGQKALAAGDFNGDGSTDLAVLLTSGDLYCYFNDRMSMPGVQLRLAQGVAGPITASCWVGEKHAFCAGALPVFSHSPAAYLSTRSPGECKIKYRLPGQPEQERTVTVEDGPKDIVLGEPARKK